MGSINPVFALKNLIEDKAEALAKEYISSLTLGVGQFCTNPGVFIALKGKSLDRFISAVNNEVQKVTPAHYASQWRSMRILKSIKQQPLHN
jgi:NADP-dependent aldehyde dehydrogenase